MKRRIFISSVQKEFAEARQALKTYIQGDALRKQLGEKAQEAA